MAELILAPGRERSVRRRHPWIFDGAVARLVGRAGSGDTVTVMTADGEPLAKAAFSPASRIRARVWSFDPAETIDHAFAPSSAHAQHAARAYKDINVLALRLLNRGGLLMTFSCSGGISAELFQKIVAGAALDADVEPRMLRRLSAAEDHPVGLNFPQGEYLKGLLCQL